MHPKCRLNFEKGTRHEHMQWQLVDRHISYNNGWWQSRCVAINSLNQSNMYRIILAAIVFLCTLECDAQTTQRLETKDVLCILWLSGIQREDLDVNMLRKLQQHNVNIDDINDIGKLRSRCLNKNYTEYINGTSEINFGKILTTKSQSPTLNESKTNADESNTIKMSELEIAVQHILNSQKFKKISNESKYNQDQEKSSYQGQHVLSKAPAENITDTITTIATPNTEVNDDEQDGLENVESNVTIAPLKRTIVNPDEMKLLNDLSNDTNLEVEHISRIIADYITRKRMLSTNVVKQSLDIKNNQMFNHVKREHSLKSVNKEVHSNKNDNPSIEKVNIKNENDTDVEATNEKQKRFSNLNEMKNNPLFIIYNEGYKDKHIMYDENKQRSVNDLFINEYVNNTSEDDDVGQQQGKKSQRDMFKEIAYSVKSIVSHYIDAPRSSPTTITTEAIKLSTTKKQNKREMDEIFMYENLNRMYQDMQASRAFITQTTEKATTFPGQDQILHGAYEMYKNFGNMYKYFKLMANNKHDEVKIITTTKVPVIQTSVRTTVAEQFKNKLHKNSNILMKLTDMYKQMQKLKISNTTSTTCTSTTVTPQPSTTVKKKVQDPSEIFNNLQELFKLLGKSPDTTTVTTTTEMTTTMTTKKARTESEETFDIMENLKEIYQKLKIPHESTHSNSEILTTTRNHIEPTEASPVYKNRYEMYTQLTPIRVDFNEQSESGPSPNQIMKPNFARYIYESNNPVNISNFQPSDIYFRGGNQQTQMDIPQNIYYNKLNPIPYKSIQNAMPYYIASQSTDSRLTLPRNGPVPFPYQAKLSVNSQSSPNNPLISQANPAISFNNNNQPNLPLIYSNKTPLTSSKNTFISPVPSIDNNPMLSVDPILSENRQVTFNNQMSSRTQQISPYDRFYSPKSRQKPPQNMFSPGARMRLAEMSPMSSYIPQISQKNRFPQSKNMPSGLHIVQTNFNEVPPLGIRVGEPLNLIHQNLVVHNKKHNNNASSNRSHRQKYHSRETEEFNEFKELTNGHKSRYHKKKDEKYKFKPKVSGKMARFHEILENSELQADNKELIPDGDNFDTDPIPPRHQVSINNIKKYENFDKNIRTMVTTQNKVHQLLDKMLEDSRERPEFDIM